jgi:hypothetical protein
MVHVDRHTLMISPSDALGSGSTCGRLTRIGSVVTGARHFLSAPTRPLRPDGVVIMYDRIAANRPATVRDWRF